MKIRIAMLVSLVGLIVVSLSGISPAQRPGAVSRDAPTNVRLAPGEQLLIHDSPDTVIELFVNMPETSQEKIRVHDGVSEKSFPLPNNAWVRVQGRVILAREGNAAAVKTLVRWRYADTIFASFSRD